ncbi:unnamed protein product [Owenia fusiformis]|uniref:Uncharacterized protein n=1 Tax=Owenia fusiformis TaxID=6347 RepID=A0A8J1U6K7_OWEFU|nr:unnamed protein product [Owenia fusiformis]
MLLYHSMLLVLLAVTLPGQNHATTAGQTTEQPTTMKPTTVKPTSMKPTTADVTTTKPTTSKPTSSKPTTMATTEGPTTGPPLVHLCPNGCNCSSMGADRIVNCTKAMLQDVPMGIPNDTTVLDLSYNNITKLNGTNSRLANLTVLRLLYIMNNTLNTVEAGAFEGCGKLSEIYFTNNSLGNNGIQPDVFNDTADQMGYLYFERNGMNENISAEMFKGIKAITGLMFANNNFTMLKKGMFKYTKSLTDVRFEYNHLKSIEGGVWDDVPTLTVMDLRYNDFNSLKYQMFKGLKSMLSLHILRCPIVNGIEDGTFQDMTKLTFLTLESNGLSKLSPDLLQGLGQLKTLRFYGNALEAVDGSTFQYSPLLEDVALWDNDISQVTGSIQTLTNLKEFSLAINRIKILKGDFFPNVTTPLSIDISRNPLHCNCFFNWTSGMSKNTTVKGNCETPRKVSGRDISKVGKSEFVCYKPTITSMTDNLTVSAGSNVTVFCAAEGDPLPIIMWKASKLGVTKVIGPPSDDSLLSNDGSLTLTNFSRPYEGNYTCSALSPLTTGSLAVRTITIKIGPNSTPSPWKVTYGQFVGSVVGAVLGTFACTVIVFLIVGYCRAKKTAGYQQTI